MQQEPPRTDLLRVAVNMTHSKRQMALQADLRRQEAPLARASQAHLRQATLLMCLCKRKVQMEPLYQQVVLMANLHTWPVSSAGPLTLVALQVHRRS